MRVHPTPMPLHQLLTEAGIPVPAGLPAATVSGIAVDSRAVRPGDLFIAICGLHTDARRFIAQAAAQGAVAVICEDTESTVADDQGLPVVTVANARVAMACLYDAWYGHPGRRLRLVGVTGTNGKTTTKELIREVLSVKYRVAATEGNLNNSIGVPLTLLKMAPDTQIAVVEMGASHPGDIKELVDIALPNYGLITNVGKAHLLGFGSFEGVKATKGELYDYLRRTADKAFINVDNPHLCQMASERNMQHDSERPYSLLLPYGLDYQGGVVLFSDEKHPFLRILCGGVIINTNLVGSYNADNVMAAIAVGVHFGVSFEDAVKAIEAYVPANKRSQMTKTERNTLIVDAYNANPTSMAAALENFSNVSADCKVAMLGDMLELGEESLAEHVAVIKSACSRGLAHVYFVGKEFQAASGALASELGTEAAAQLLSNAYFFSTSDELAAHLASEHLSGATILIKGSRGTRMENVIPVL